MQEARRGRGRPACDDEPLFAAAVWLVHLSPHPTSCITLADVVNVLGTSREPAVANVVAGRVPDTIKNRLSRYRAKLAAAIKCDPSAMLPGLDSWSLSLADGWAEAAHLPVVWHREPREASERAGATFLTADRMPPGGAAALGLAMLVRRNLTALPREVRAEAKRLSDDLIQRLEIYSDLGTHS